MPTATLTQNPTHSPYLLTNDELERWYQDQVDELFTERYPSLEEAKLHHSEGQYGLRRFLEGVYEEVLSSRSRD